MWSFILKTLITNIIFVVMVVIATWTVQSRYFPTVEREITTDSVFVNVPYETEVIKEVDRVVEKEVVRYKTEVDTIRELRVVTDTVFVSTDNATYTYHPSFLTQYPSAHKLLGLVRNRGHLSVTTLDTNGITETKTWEVSENYTVDHRLNLSSQDAPRFGYNYRFGTGYIQWWENGSPYLEMVQEIVIFNLNIENRVNINRNPFVSIGVTW